jgi:hypothetical protein
MNLEAEIQRRWAVDHTLAGLVPTDRVFTGAAGGAPALPYVVVHRLPEAKAERTSSGKTIARTRLRLNIWATALEQAAEIARAAAARLDRADFELADGRVLDVVVADETHDRQNDGTWRVALELLVTHLHTRGVANHG